MLTKIEFNYIKIKLWLVIIVIQAISFGMGMYTAHTYWKPKPQPSIDLNYTTKSTETQNQDGGVVPANTNQNDNGTMPIDTSQSLDPTNCAAIKGNVSGANKTYHVPGGAFYDRTTAEMCFATELEAQSAGFKKSSL